MGNPRSKLLSAFRFHPFLSLQVSSLYFSPSSLSFSPSSVPSRLCGGTRSALAPPCGEIRGQKRSQRKCSLPILLSLCPQLCYVAAELTNNDSALTTLKLILLAIIQGLTEFLPVSSSGHLVIGKHLLSLDSPGASLEIALHAGTLIAILVYYRNRIARLIRDAITGKRDALHYAMVICVSAIPAVIVYFLCHDAIEGLFDKPVIVGGLLCATGLVLLSMRVGAQQSGGLTIARGIAMGFGQAFALLPGISRSGMTIAIGRRSGLSPENTVEFSLLMAVPVLAGATLLKSFGTAEPHGDVTNIGLLLGIVVAGAVGYLAIVCLVKALRAGKLWLFGFYCLVAGIAAIAVNL